MKLNKDTWVVIPAYNESRTVRKVIDSVKDYTKNIIVVDDGSEDNTYDIAKKQGIHALRQIVNLGKGTALKTGCDFAIKKGAKTIITMDADTQHEASDIPKFIDALNGNDIVIGKRGLNKKMPLIFRMGNLILNSINQILFKVNIQDTQSGFRAFNTNSYDKLLWKSQDYSMEAEMVANIGKHRLKYKEIPIKTIYADRYKGTTILDGIKIGLKMLEWRLTR